MLTLVPANLINNDLHGRTAKLAQDAGEAGDAFLKYLFVMALRHIEETATPAETETLAETANDSAKASHLTLASSR